MTTTIKVDVVERNKALITGPTFSGYVGRHWDGPGFYVEDTDGGEEVIGTTSRRGKAGYERAARMLAKRYNLTDFTIAIDYEY